VQNNYFDSNKMTSL